MLCALRVLLFKFLPSSAPQATLLELEEIPQDLPAVFSEDALRMKLNAPNRKLLVFHAHDFAFLRFGGDFQAIRQRLPANYQRVIARGGKRIGHAFEKIFRHYV